MLIAVYAAGVHVGTTYNQEQKAIHQRVSHHQHLKGHSLGDSDGHG